MILKRIAPFSLAKISGVLYAIIGLLVGGFFAMLSTIGGAATESFGGRAFGAMFGVGAIIFLPFMYGIIGFIGSLIGAAIYNMLAGAVGGIELELVAKPGTMPSAPPIMTTPHA